MDDCGSLAQCLVQALEGDATVRSEALVGLCDVGAVLVLCGDGGPGTAFMLLAGGALSVASCETNDPELRALGFEVVGTLVEALDEAAASLAAAALPLALAALATGPDLDDDDDWVADDVFVLGVDDEPLATAAAAAMERVVESRQASSPITLAHVDPCSITLAHVDPCSITLEHMLTRARSHSSTC